LRTSRRNIFASAIFMLMLAVLISASGYVIANFGKPQQSDGFGLWIKVERLPQKPQSYFQLNEPDSYVLQAISNLGTMVHVGDWSYTQVDDLTIQNGVGNFEYNNTYYSVGCLSADPGPLISNDTIAMVVLGWLVFGVALIVTMLAMMGRLPLREIFLSKTEASTLHIWSAQEASA